MYGKIFRRIGLFGLLLLAACQGPGCSPVLSPGATPSQPATSPAASSTPMPLSAGPTRAATRESYLYSRTATVEVEQTQIYETNTASGQTAVASFNLTATAILREIQVTVTPRVFQSMPSPDGKYTAQVTVYDCAQILPGQEPTNAYEVLTIGPWTVETQLLYCGGLGTAGLGGKFWSPDSRFFYYTDAREGWPDGGYPWERPIYRFDVTTGKRETLAVAMFSPDKKKIAGAQGADLVVWAVDSDAVTRFPGQTAAGVQSWVNWLAWSPDGRSLAYLTQSTCHEGSYPCPSTLTRADLDSQAQTPLLGKDDPPMLMVEWPQPDTLLLFGTDFQSRYRYDLKTGRLSPAPATTPTPFTRPTATPAPTYPPDPAYPPDVYPPAKPFRRPVEAKGVTISGHGCPDLTHVQAAAEPGAETLQPILEAVRSGDVARVRANSDVAYWPATGLSLSRQALSISLYPGHVTIQPAALSPLAGLLGSACGAGAARVSWWVQVQADDGLTDYYLLQRQDRWLVWMSAYSY